MWAAVVDNSSTHDFEWSHDKLFEGRGGVKFLRGKAQKNFVPVDSAMYYYFHGILHCLSNIHHLNQLSNGDRCVCMCVFSKEVS